MTRETPGVGRWREGRGPARPASPARLSAQKWAAAVLIASILFVFLAATAWLAWQFAFPQAPHPYFVSFWIDQSQARPAVDRADRQGTRLAALVPAIPWLEAERTALQNAGVFPRTDAPDDQTRNTPKEAMETRLGALASLKPADALVVYIAAHALVDPKGKIQVLAYDSDPYRPETLLSLESILSRLKQCPARNKLLVLDLARATTEPLALGGTSDGVPDVLSRQLHSAAGKGEGESDDPNLLVLATCAPGQAALGAETLGRSVFGEFFLRGLTDPAADANRDRAVSVRELTNYLGTKVDQWTRHYRDARQRPIMAGDGKDFLVASLGKRQPSTTKATRKAWRWPWQRTQVAKAEKPAAEGTDEKAAVKTAAKGAEKDAGKPAAKDFEATGARYPRWLADGWEERDRWWAGDALLVAPREYRRLEAVLLRAEARWRGGADPEGVRPDLEAERNALSGALERDRTVPQPREPRSVGQARSLGWKSDPTLADAFRRLLRTPVGQVDAKRKDEFLAPFKGKSSLEFTAALVDAVESESFDARALELLDALVEQARLPRDMVELRFLHQLADRFKPPGDDALLAIARQAWNVVVAAERADSRPASFAWIGGQLAQADAARHDGEILLLPQAADDAALSDVSATWTRAQRAYEAVADFQDRLDAARTQHARAVQRLHAAIPYFESAPDLDTEDAWSKLADAAARLDPLLERPEVPLGPDQIVALNRQLSDALGGVNEALRTLERPFQGETLRDLVADCLAKEKRPDPALAVRVEALLASPIAPLADRLALWRAGRVLDQRLAAVPMPEPEASSTDDADERVRQRVVRRARRLSRLLALCGREGEAREKAPESAPVEPRWDTADPGALWSDLAGYAVKAHARFEQALRPGSLADGRDRAGRTAPVFMTDWRRNPTRDRRVDDARSAWEWLAAHYLQEARDLFDPDLGDSPRYYEKAAWDCWTCDPKKASELPPETYVEIRLDTQTPARLSREHPSADVAVACLLHAADDQPRRVNLALIQPDDPRLRLTLTGPSELELKPDVPATVTVRVAWSEEGEALPARANPRGFLVEARLANGSSYHAIVPTDVVSESIRPRLVLALDPAQPVELPSDDLRLRPIPGRQPYYLLVRNPAPAARDVVVEVLGPGGGASLSAKVKLEGNKTHPVPGFGQPPPKAGEPLAELSGPLRIRLREDKPGGSELDLKEIRARIATRDDYLTDYVELGQAQFLPSDPSTGRNRLSVTLRALERLSDPACAVELVLPRDRTLFPALREPPRGTLSGKLVPNGTVALFAEAIALDPAAPENGLFYLNIDGIERALWMRTTFARAGGPQRAVLDSTVRLRLAAEVKPDPPSPTLTVRFAVDNAPDNGRLVVRLGRLEGGQIVDDLTPWTAPPRDRHLGFDARGENGALLFEAAVRDWTHVFDIRGIRGERMLEARLLDSTGRKVLARQTLRLTLDDQVPADLALQAPRQVPRGTSMVTLRGNVTPPASGIKEVLFFVGAKADLEKARAAGQAVLARATSSTQTSWEAVLPLPKGAEGEIPVSARFTSGIGLAETITQPITVLAPPPPPPSEEEKAKAKEPPKPGAIAGKVVEGSLGQTGLPVYLYTLDPDAKKEEKNRPIASTTTKPGGAYEFKDLKAGQYNVYCVKESNGRRALKTVSVEAGATAQTDLELYLP